MTPEAKVKKKVVAVLKQHKAYYFYPVTGGYGRSGVPDVIACHNGRFIGIECKVNLEQIERAGGVSLVVNEDNISIVEETLLNMEKQHNGF